MSARNYIQDYWTVGLVFAVLGAVVVSGGFGMLSFMDQQLQQNECTTVTNNYNVECSDVDSFGQVRGASSQNTSFGVQLTSLDAAPYGDEPVYVPWLYNNGFAASGDYGSSIGEEDLSLESDTLQRLVDGSKCRYRGSMSFRDDDVFITTSEGEFNFDNDPENPGEQHIRELDLGQASVTTDDVRLKQVNDANTDVVCVFDLYDVAEQAVEAEYPGEFESISSYGNVVLTGTVSTEFGFPVEEDDPDSGEQPSSSPDDDSDVDQQGFWSGFVEYLQGFIFWR